jgi:hypothetical protein
MAQGQQPQQRINFAVPLVSSPPVTSTTSTCSISQQSVDGPRQFMMFAERGEADGAIVEQMMQVQGTKTALVARDCHNTVMQFVNGKDVYQQTDANGTTRQIVIPRTQVLSTTVEGAPGTPIPMGSRGASQMVQVTPVKTTNPGEFRYLSAGSSNTKVPPPTPPTKKANEVKQAIQKAPVVAAASRSKTLEPPRPAGMASTSTSASATRAPPSAVIGGGGGGEGASRKPSLRVGGEDGIPLPSPTMLREQTSF